MVLEHLPLVKAIAVRVHENLPVHVDLDDLVHAGILGLFDAANKYNPEKQVVFSSYAKHRIKGAILDSLRQLDWASRDMRRRHKQVEAATRDLASTLQRAPTEAEVAEKLGMDVDRWRTMMLDLRNVGLISASTRVQRKRRSSRARFSEQARDAARFHLRARTAAQRAGRRHEDAAGALSESRAAVLHQRNDDEGNRRRAGHQRKPRFPDPQIGARKDAVALLKPTASPPAKHSKALAQGQTCFREVVFNRGRRAARFLNRFPVALSLNPALTEENPTTFRKGVKFLQPAFRTQGQAARPRN